MSSSELRWQCRRGMRELDVLLERWLNACFDGASEREKSVFSTLLKLSDPELARYLLAGDLIDDPELAHVIYRIRGNAPD